MSNPFDNIQPQSQLHCTKLINNQNVDISFRYFSPSKFMKDSINTNQAKYSRQSSSEKSKNKYGNQQLSPQNHQQNNKQYMKLEQHSLLFYPNSIRNLQHPLLNYYEQFHQKLVHRINLQQKLASNKVIKIKLTRDKQSLQNKQSSLNGTNKFIKNVQINLNSSAIFINHQLVNQSKNVYSNTFNQYNRSNVLKQISNQKNNVNPKNVSQNPKKNQYKIKIKLYQNNKNLLNNPIIQSSFKTPRKSSNSKRKGILVYSSQKKNKNLSQQLQNHSQNKQNIIHSTSIPPKNRQNQSSIKSKTNKQKIQIHLINSKKQPKTSARLKKNYQNLCTQRNRLKTEYKSRRRLCSKDKLKKTVNPANKYYNSRHLTPLRNSRK